MQNTFGFQILVWLVFYAQDNSKQLSEFLLVQPRIACIESLSNRNETKLIMYSIWVLGFYAN